jgi:hypothetical protein
VVALIAYHASPAGNRLSILERGLLARDIGPRPRPVPGEGRRVLAGNVGVPAVYLSLDPHDFEHKGEVWGVDLAGLPWELDPHWSGGLRVRRDIEAARLIAPEVVSRMRGPP